MTVTTTTNGTTTVTNSGIINSFAHTPQAKNDLFKAGSTGITKDSRSVILDVMGNDLGGKGKALWSLDDGISAGGNRSTDLLTQDSIGAVQYSARGAAITITADGKVSYTMTTASTAYLQSLGAGTDTFTYAIRLGDGTISWATATVEIKGANVAAILSSAVVVLAETNAALTTSGKIGVATEPNRIPCGTGRGSKNSLRKLDCCSRLRVLSKSRRDWRFDHKCPVSITQ